MNKRDLRLYLSISSLTIFLLILFFVLINFTFLDNFLNNSIYNPDNLFINNFFIFLGNYLKIILISLAIFFIIFLYYKKKKEESLILFSGLLMGYFLEKLFKLLVQRTRPINQLISETSYSFPSGHSIYAIILFSFLIYFYKESIKEKLLRNIFLFINIFLILLVGFSRIYIRVHWFSDVIAGYFLGFFIFNSILFLLEIFKKEH